MTVDGRIRKAGGPLENICKQQHVTLFSINKMGGGNRRLSQKLEASEVRTSQKESSQVVASRNRHSCLPQQNDSIQSERLSPNKRPLT